MADLVERLRGNGSLLYRDVAGNKIDEPRWRFLYRRDRYGRPRREVVDTPKGKVEMELSWVGLASSLEAVPKFWLVRAWLHREVDEKKVVREELPELACWCEDRFAGLRAMTRVVEGLRKGAES